MSDDNPYAHAANWPIREPYPDLRFQPGIPSEVCDRATRQHRALTRAIERRAMNKVVLQEFLDTVGQLIDTHRDFLREFHSQRRGETDDTDTDPIPTVVEEPKFVDKATQTSPEQVSSTSTSSTSTHYPLSEYTWLNRR